MWFYLFHIAISVKAIRYNQIFQWNCKKKYSWDFLAVIFYIIHTKLLIKKANSKNWISLKEYSVSRCWVFFLRVFNIWPRPLYSQIVGILQKNINSERVWRMYIVHVIINACIGIFRSIRYVSTVVLSWKIFRNLHGIYGKSVRDVIFSNSGLLLFWTRFFFIFVSFIFQHFFSNQ